MRCISKSLGGEACLVATNDPELNELCCDYVLCIENGRAGYLRRMKKA